MTYTAPRVKMRAFSHRFSYQRRRMDFSFLFCISPPFTTTAATAVLPAAVSSAALVQGCRPCVPDLVFTTRRYYIALHWQSYLLHHIATSPFTRTRYGFEAAKWAAILIKSALPVAINQIGF